MKGVALCLCLQKKEELKISPSVYSQGVWHFYHAVHDNFSLNFNVSQCFAEL